MTKIIAPEKKTKSNNNKKKWTYLVNRALELLNTHKKQWTLKNSNTSTDQSILKIERVDTRKCFQSIWKCYGQRYWEAVATSGNIYWENIWAMSLPRTEKWEILPAESGSKTVEESSPIRVVKIIFFVSHPALQSL